MPRAVLLAVPAVMPAVQLPTAARVLTAARAASQAARAARVTVLAVTAAAAMPRAATAGRAGLAPVRMSAAASLSERLGARLGHVTGRKAADPVTGTGQRASRVTAAQRASGAASSGQPGGPRRPGLATGRGAGPAPGQRRGHASQEREARRALGKEQAGRGR
jgi:hypothetical protein